MLKQIMAATGDLFPLLEIFFYGMVAFAWGMYHTRGLTSRSPDEERSPAPRKERRRIAHKPA